MDLKPQSQSSQSPTKLRVMRVLAYLVVPIIFISFLAFGLLKKATPKVQVGAPAPEFSLPILGKSELLTSSDLHGNVIVLNFWASWCIPCREEAPDLESAWKKYKSREVIVIGVNVMDSEKNAENFVQEFGLTYPVVRDVNQTLGAKLGVTGIPETFFIDRHYRFAGRSASRQIDTKGSTVVRGPITYEQLRLRLESLIGNQD